jgi:hypothetical protein
MHSRSLVASGKPGCAPLQASLCRRVGVSEHHASIYTFFILVFFRLWCIVVWLPSHGVTAVGNKSQLSNVGAHIGVFHQLVSREVEDSCLCLVGSPPEVTVVDGSVWLEVRELDNISTDFEATGSLIQTCLRLTSWTIILLRCSSMMSIPSFLNVRSVAGLTSLHSCPFLGIAIDVTGS